MTKARFTEGFKVEAVKQLIKGSFDLMVDDLDATHERFTGLGLEV